MKTTLALWIVSALLGGGHQRQHPVRWLAPASIAQERFQAGPLSLELCIQHAHLSEAGDSSWPGSNLPPADISVNTDFAASLTPFAVRIVVVLILGSDPPATATGAASPPNNNGPPNWEGRC